MKQTATILLVEDDQSMLNGMRDLLQAADIGFEVKILTASDGHIGLQEINKRRPDLIVSDIMMPSMDGFQLLQSVRANPNWVHIPFLFLTAKGEQQEVHEGHLSGADLYIVKPFDSSLLLELIKSQLIKSFQLQSTHQEHVKALKKDILQILNHEFRTPLTYVTAYYEMLADGVNKYAGQKDFQGYLRGIQAGCIRLTRLVEDLIQVLELRTGEAERVFRQHARTIDDIGSLIEIAIEMKQAAADRYGISIHSVVDEALPNIYGDRDSLINVFIRLLDNAIKFSSSKDAKGKVVHVSLQALNDEVHVCFNDEGFGFPASIKDRIFELFFQHNRGLIEQQGAGIGLTIAEGLVKLHQGRIEVHSEEGVGSKFTVILPAHNSDPDKALRSELHARPKSATVLIVEDDPFLLDGLKELLEISAGKYAYRVLTADNGESGLHVLSNNQVDLIISDIMMPHMGGFEFLNAVRHNPSWFHLPFIFLTARAEQQDVYDGLRSGAELYITKPYNHERLLELVASQLDRFFQVQGILAQDLSLLKQSILNLITPAFRLPLSSVTQYSEQLAHGLDKAQTSEELKRSLYGIQESSVRLTRLVEDFVSLAELRMGEAATAHQLHAQPIANIGALFCELAQICAVKQELSHFHFHCQKQVDLPVVFGNSSTLIGSIQRLIEASISHFRLEPGANIHLSAKKVNDEVLLSIRFPVVLNEHSFERFSNILSSVDEDDPQLADDAPSLSIAREYILMHQGHFTLQRDQPIGLCLTVVLPAYISNAEQARRDGSVSG